MSEHSPDFLNQAAQAASKTEELIGRLLAASEAEAIYGNPVQKGDYTLITASELVVGMGVGNGGGYGPGTVGDPMEVAQSGGFGSGGGGFSHARPVATIAIGPEGVSVTPVLDATKLGITFLTTLAAILLALFRLLAVWRSPGRP